MGRRSLMREHGAEAQPMGARLISARALCGSTGQQSTAEQKHGAGHSLRSCRRRKEAGSDTRAERLVESGDAVVSASRKSY
uniref:Uncharacterized protein n=1 Tax=Knipowitschia caucasica TaxID=637954 RepID=A0AAV2KLF9_KNICA